MAGKKLNTVGFQASAGSARPVTELVAEHNRAVSAGLFEPENMAKLTRDQQLASWGRFFEIGARADELPAWLSKPDLTESNGRIVPTAGGMGQPSADKLRERSELRQAVDTMRSNVGKSKPLSREAMVRMAQSSFGSIADGTAPSGPDGPFR